jgi:quercetin dioxygenase-like cupin family protein
MQGKLEYTIQTDETYLLEPGKNGVIEPEIVHHIKLMGPVEFFVELYT